MKVTIKGFVHKNKYSGEFEIRTCDMSEYGDILVAEAEFEYEVPPDFNPVASEVAALNKALDTLANEYHGKVAQIKGRINDLLCLEAPTPDDSDVAECDRPLPTSAGLYE